MPYRSTVASEVNYWTWTKLMKVLFLSIFLPKPGIVQAAVITTVGPLESSRGTICLVLRREIQTSLTNSQLSRNTSILMERRRSVRGSIISIRVNTLEIVMTRPLVRPRTVSILVRPATKRTFDLYFSILIQRFLFSVLIIIYNH